MHKLHSWQGDRHAQKAVASEAVARAHELPKHDASQDRETGYRSALRTARLGARSRFVPCCACCESVLGRNSSNLLALADVCFGY